MPRFSFSLSLTPRDLMNWRTVDDLTFGGKLGEAEGAMQTIKTIQCLSSKPTGQKHFQNTVHVIYPNNWLA